MAHTLVVETWAPRAVNWSIDSWSTGNSCRSAVPAPAVSPPYMW